MDTTRAKAARLARVHTVVRTRPQGVTLQRLRPTLLGLTSLVSPSQAGLSPGLANES